MDQLKNTNLTCNNYLSLYYNTYIRKYNLAGNYLKIYKN